MSNPKLVWIDLEMTGLGDNHVILEIASLVTDHHLEILAEGPNLAIKRTLSEINSIPIEAWSKNQHTSSGLLKRVENSETNILKAETMTLDFLHHWTEKEKSPLCGNSIWVDRKFLRKEMPRLESHLNYRMIDVSTIKELMKRWYPDLELPKKNKSHLALDDIRESVNELKWYRDNIFKNSILT